MINKKKTLRNATQLATGYKTGYNCRTAVPIDTVHHDGKREETLEFFKRHQSTYFQQGTRQQTTVVHVLLMYTVQDDDKKEEDDCQ